VKHLIIATTLMLLVGPTSYAAEPIDWTPLLNLANEWAKTPDQPQRQKPTTYKVKRLEPRFHGGTGPAPVHYRVTDQDGGKSECRWKAGEANPYGGFYDDTLVCD